MTGSGDHSIDVTVVIAVRNEAQHIEACLRSITEQSWDGWQCIVVDDGSTDGTREIVAAIADARISLIDNPGTGVSAARNAGLGAATGRYIMFLDGNDLIEVDALQRLRLLLIDAPDAILAYGTFVKMTHDGHPYPGQRSLDTMRYPAGELLDTLLQSNIFANGGHLLAQRDAVLAVGGFDERLALSEDWHLWCKLAALGTFAFAGNAPCVMHMRMPQSLASATRSADWRQHRPAIRAVLTNPSVRRAVPADKWRPIRRTMIAAHMWECGRVNFTLRRFRPACRLMLRALAIAPEIRRFVHFVVVWTGWLVGARPPSRFRYRDQDAPQVEPRGHPSRAG